MTKRSHSVLVTELDLQIASFLVTICDCSLIFCVIISASKGKIIDWYHMKEKKTIKDYKEPQCKGKESFFRDIQMSFLLFLTGMGSHF